MNAPSRVEAELSMSDFLALAQPGVQKLSPYVPGKPVDELARELGIDLRRSSSSPATRTRWVRAQRRWRLSAPNWRN